MPTSCSTSPGRPSVTASWGDGFAPYAHNNVEATQRLLEGCVGAGLRRFVYGSSSSVYGNARSLPTAGDGACRSRSRPYGVSKLAGEHLCGAYHHSMGLPVTALRFFTVYGPRQRPDMAFHKLFRAALRGDPFRVWGDGTATRDFTFIDDIVDRPRSAPGPRTGTASPTSAAATGPRCNELLAAGRGAHRADRHPLRGARCRRRAGHLRRRERRPRPRWATSPTTDLRTGLAAMHAWVAGTLDLEPTRA